MLVYGSTLRNGRYVIETLLGSGGMGGVYRAYDSLLGRHVAIKQALMPPGLSPNERQHLEAVLDQEARILAKFQHPNVVGVNDCFHEADATHLVMDFIEGCDLQRVLDGRPGGIDVADVMAWAEQICSALGHLHEHRVLVRDLKPANVMLDDGGRIRLIDFGIARIEQGGDRTASAIRGYGSEGYAPVEQYGTGHTDIRSDIYALGATIHALLCGHRPPSSICLASGDATLCPPSGTNPGVPALLDRVIARMMCTHKEARHATVAEAWHALRIACLPTVSPQSVRASSEPYTLLTTPVAYSLPSKPLTGAEGLRMLNPTTIVYSGSLLGAQDALARTTRAGMCAQVLPSGDTYLTMRPGAWVVSVGHPPHGGGYDACARPVAS